MKKILIPATNYIANVVQTQSLVGSAWPAEAVPRPRARMMIKKKRARTPWDFSMSVFADYKPDTEVRHKSYSGPTRSVFLIRLELEQA